MRKSELLPFYDAIYNKSKEKAQGVLDKLNENCSLPQ